MKEHPKSVTITRFRRLHLASAVRIHLGAFPHFFLTFLGARFLREFYAAFLDDLGALAFVAEGENAQLYGVIIGTTMPNGFFKRLIFRRWWAFSFASAMAVIQSPSICPRLIRALWYRGNSPSGPSRALLSSIAVTPEMQGHGIGRKLVERWLEEAQSRGCVGCYLTTDAHDNRAANAFYLNTKWELETSYMTPEKRVMNRYIFDF